MSEVNKQVEYIRIGFAFVGALLGALVGTPFIEWFKDQLGAKRQWKTQRHDIVGTVRLTMGILRAFDELRIEAFGYPWEAVSFSWSAFSRLTKFDFQLFDEHVVKLAYLHPDDSGRSAVAQRLVQHLLVLRRHFQQLQEFSPISITQIPGNTQSLGLSREDEEVLKQSDKKFIDLQRFLVGIYAERLGINAMSLVIDSEITDFERTMASQDLNESQKELKRRIQAYNDRSS